MHVAHESSIETDAMKQYLVYGFQKFDYRRKPRYLCPSSTFTIMWMPERV